MPPGFQYLTPAHLHCPVCPVAKHGLCNKLPRSDLAKIANRSKVALLKKGTTILRQGEQCRRIGIVISGISKIVHYSKEGAKTVLQLGHSGELVGAPLSQVNNFATEAATDMTICFASANSINSLLKTHNDISLFYFSRMQRSLEAGHMWSVKMRNRTSLERVAFWIFDQMSRSLLSKGTSIPVRLSRRDLSAYLNMSEETLCRSLQTLIRENVINLPSSSGVEVCNVEKLELLATRDGMSKYKQRQVCLA